MHFKTLKRFVLLPPNVLPLLLRIMFFVVLLAKQNQLHTYGVSFGWGSNSMFSSILLLFKIRIVSVRHLAMSEGEEIHNFTIDLLRCKSRFGWEINVGGFIWAIEHQVIEMHWSKQALCNRFESSHSHGTQQNMRPHQSPWKIHCQCSGTRHPRDIVRGPFPDRWVLTNKVPDRWL